VLASARQLEQSGRLPEANRAYQAILQRYPQHVGCLHRLAVVNTRLNDFETARSYFDKALQLSPENVSILTDAGYARYLAGDHRQAERLLRKAIELAPRDVRATNNLAVVIGVSGRFNEALALFQQVNRPAVAWTNLAYVYQLRREPELALACYQRARALDATVHVPEELVAQTAPAEPVVTEADLPPLPTARAVADPAQAMMAEPAVARSDAASAESGAWPVVTPAFRPERPDSQERFEHPLADEGEDFMSPTQGSAPAESQVEDPFELPLEAPSAASDAESSPFEAPFPIGAGQALDSEADEAAFIDAEYAKLAARADRDGFKGFCLVTLYEERRLVDAVGEFTIEHQGQSYQFSSSDAAERFRADPARYVPAAGGLDVVAVYQGKDVIPGSLDYAVWYRDRLYMFSSQAHKNEFRASPRKFVIE
jgi:Flp pilus assembly protein TadD/YHS domain-containing protein